MKGLSSADSPLIHQANLSERGPERPYCLQRQQQEFEVLSFFVDHVVHSVGMVYLPGGRRQPGMIAATDPGTVASIVDRLEGMFQQLLTARVQDPQMVVGFAKTMEAFSRLLALRKSLAAPAIAKVRISLLNSLQTLLKNLVLPCKLGILNAMLVSEHHMIFMV